MKPASTSFAVVSTNEFVSELLFTRIPSWIRNVVHDDFRFRLDIEQIANDSAFEISDHLSETFDELKTFDLDRARRLSYRITIRVTLNAIKHARRLKRFSFTQDLDKHVGLNDLFRNWQFEDRGQECDDAMKTYLASISVKRQRVVNLRMAGLANMEIADELKISIRHLQRLLKTTEEELVELLLPFQRTKNKEQKENSPRVH